MEIKDRAQAMTNGQFSPKRFENLIKVFRLGLINHVITINEVKDWADRIIMTEDEPDYFFIELSTAKTVNDLVTILDTQCSAPDILSKRVVLGLIYQQLKTFKLKPEEAFEILHSFSFSEHFTMDEYFSLIYIEDWFECGDENAEEGLTVFLEQYSRFNLSNFQSWEFINSDLEIKQSDLERHVKQNVYQPSVHESTNRRFNEIIRSGLIITLIASVFIVIVYLAASYHSSSGNTIPLSPLITVLLILSIHTYKASKRY